MNATLLAVGENSKAGNYANPTPMMMVGTTEDNDEDKAFVLTPHLVGYIAAALKVAG